MSVYEYIQKRRRESPLHFTLIDPDKQSVEAGVGLAKQAKEFGTDAIMVGGSTPTVLLTMDELVKRMREEVGLPVILFPFSHSALSRNADSVFFMSLLNSRTTQYLIEEQMRGAVVVRDFGLETLPMGYMIVEGGKTTSAAFGSDAKPIPRDKPEFAAAYSLAAKYFGMRFVYLEGGSGAEFPVQPEMVAAVKKTIGEGVFLIVGGGIKTPELAKDRVDAGADIIVTGTIAEKDQNVLREIIKTVKGK